MTVELREFLTARLAEDEAVAREASEKLTRRPHKGQGATWRVFLQGHGDGWAIESADGEHSFIVGFPESLSTHIARHDPARVLRDVEAKRRLLVLHAPDADGDCSTCCGGSELEVLWDGDEETNTEVRRPLRSPCPSLLALAAPFADHPDYNPSWSPEPTA